MGVCCKNTYGVDMVPRKVWIFQDDGKASDRDSERAGVLV